MTTKTYNYEAIDAAGVVVKGKIESDSPDAAAKSLANQRLVPLEISGLGTGMNKELKIPGLGGRTGLKDLAVFARQFASMTSSGLTLIRALGILEEQTEKPKFKAAVAKIRSDVQAGSTLSSSMAQHPDHFPPLMINMIRAGEAGGFLDDALSRIAKMYEADASLRAKIKSAMTYPVIVLIFSLLLGTGVIMFIVPVFEKMFKQLGGSLPLPTQILVTLSHNMAWILPIMIIAIVGSLKSYRKAMQTNTGFRLKVDRLKLRLPVFGTLFTKLAISRWARNFGTLLAVGVPVIQALDVVGGTAGNSVIAEAMDDVRDTVRRGGQMSSALAKHPLFPTMVTQMMEVG
ncbi:MAG: type II secretion system F family protein, partial [Jatrophihabitantaceae bacterium]